jgi:hypothetical protein
MDYFYDGQIRRYVTQFMRVFIGFKYQAGDGTQRTAPVMYGDLSRQVASIIKENSENKMPSVPRIACYITGFELDRTRLADPSFISKINIRERAYEFNDSGEPEYQNYQGKGYTVERLMPTPFKLKMKADIWTSNTEQKLQLLEQITVLFNPSLEIQTTDNYIDWTSLSVIDLESISFSSRSIPVGAESDIDICSMEFTMPVYISPPAKVKKLGIIKTVIANIFTENGEITDLKDLVYNDSDVSVSVRIATDNTSVLLMKGPDGTGPNDYYLTFDKEDTWTRVLAVQGGSANNGLIHFMQPTGFEITGTFSINSVDPSILVVTLDEDTIPSNTEQAIDRIVDPYNFNPRTFYNGNIPTGTRLLLLDNIGAGKNFTFITENNNTTLVDTEVNFNLVKQFKLFVNEIEVSGSLLSSKSIDGIFYIELDQSVAIQRNKTVRYVLNFNTDGPDAWKNLDGTDVVFFANSIIEWSGDHWFLSFDSETQGNTLAYVQHLSTFVQYRWDGLQWLRSFEGDYDVGYWRLQLD